MNFTKSLLFFVSIFSSVSAFAAPRSLVFSEMTKSDFESVFSTKDEVTVEFRQGDALPFEFVASGDLLETQGTKELSKVTVKRGFYIRKSEDDKILVSLDGESFKPVFEVITGSLNLGASAAEEGKPIDKLSLNLTAKIRAPKDSDPNK